MNNSVLRLKGILWQEWPRTSPYYPCRTPAHFGRICAPRAFLCHINVQRPLVTCCHLLFGDLLSRYLDKISAWKIVLWGESSRYWVCRRAQHSFLWALLSANLFKKQYSDHCGSHQHTAHMLHQIVLLAIPTTMDSRSCKSWWQLNSWDRVHYF